MSFCIDNAGYFLSPMKSQTSWYPLELRTCGLRPLRFKLHRNQALHTDVQRKSSSVLVTKGFKEAIGDADVFSPLLEGRLSDCLEKVYSQSMHGVMLNEKDIKASTIVNRSYGLDTLDKKGLDQNDMQKEKRGNNNNNEYYLNLGKAVETIKEEFPKMFTEDLTYDIYRDDIIFRDPLNKFQGLKFYKYMFLSLRWHARIFFKNIHVEIRNIWLAQDGIIRVRWSVFGNPRIPWEAEGIFDGVSTYKLDNHGKIFEHAVDNIIFRDPPMLKLPVLFKTLSRPAVATRPYPGIWCGRMFGSLFFMTSHFSWVRMYCALYVASLVYSTASHSEQEPCVFQS